jgi:hypothetical protein
MVLRKIMNISGNILKGEKRRVGEGEKEIRMQEGMTCMTICSYNHFQ